MDLIIYPPIDDNREIKGDHAVFRFYFSACHSKYRIWTGIELSQRVYCCVCEHGSKAGGDEHLNYHYLQTESVWVVNTMESIHRRLLLMGQSKSDDYMLQIIHCRRTFEIDITSGIYIYFLEINHRLRCVFPFISTFYHLQRRYYCYYQFHVGAAFFVFYSLIRLFIRFCELALK